MWSSRPMHFSTLPLNGAWLTESGVPVDEYDRNPVAVPIAFTAAGIYAPGPCSYSTGALGGKDGVTLEQQIIT